MARLLQSVGGKGKEKRSIMPNKDFKGTCVVRHIPKTEAKREAGKCSKAGGVKEKKTGN